MVISSRNGCVEKVPYARNCAVPSKLRSVTVLGRTLIDSKGSGAGDEVTVTVAVLAATLLPAGVLAYSAVIVVVPTLAPWATPLPEARPVVTPAIEEILELHVSCGELVTST